MVAHSSLVFLTPLKQAVEHNIVRIHRAFDLDGDRLSHIAGGEHTGIIINKLSEFPPDENPDVELYFSVWLNDGVHRKQEKRTLRFRLANGIVEADGRAVVHNFFKMLLINMPKDYVSFMKRVLKQMQSAFPEIAQVELDMKLVSEEEQIAIPDATQYDSGSEIEEVFVGHVQEILEHAFPNGLPVNVIAESLRCTEDDANSFLLELEASGIARKVDNEWLRVDTRNVDGAVASQRATSAAGGSKGGHPTVAIITCLFLEKQAVDALIDEPEIVHRYKSGGDSNAYTLGRIGSHNVVATKLAMVGDSREAMISAGSITTRLLGNFQRIEHVFIVGVGGSVPHYTDAKLHSRLGDVIISSCRPDAYVYAHNLLLDRHTEALTGFAVRKWNPQDNVIERVILEGGDSLIGDWEGLTGNVVERLTEQSDQDFSRPPPESDVLALSVGGGNVVVVPHPNTDRKGSLVHLGPVGALANKFNRDAVEEEESVSQIRERFSAEYHLRALDAGFDSVIAAVDGSRIDSWALIRGVADYQHGQSRAAKMWQAHAAARAAAMVRTIVERLPPA